MSGVGGLQRPTNPAPVSGPGALSQRTDGGPAQAMRSLPDAKYGENAAFRGIESGAPMAAAPSPSSGGADAGGSSPASAPPALTPPPPLTDGTTRPDEPVTHGADAGPGASSAVMALPDPSGAGYKTVASQLQQLAAQSGNPDIQLLAGLAGNGRF